MSLPWPNWTVERWEHELRQSRVLASRSVLDELAAVRVLGGPGSGHFGHAGRPGQVGGSVPGTLPAGSYGLLADDTVREDWTNHGPDVPLTIEEKTTLSHDAYLDQVDEWAENRDNDYAEKMKHALRDYRGNGFIEMNRLLMREPDLLDDFDPDGPELTSDFDDAVELQKTTHNYWLSELIDGAPRIEDPEQENPAITVYRGAGNYSPLNDAAVGDVVRLDGFQSATFDPKVALDYVKRRNGRAGAGGQFLEVRTDQGLALGEAHSIEGEVEHLLPHGVSFKVVGRKKIPVRNKAGDVEMADAVQLVDLGLAKRIEASQ